MMRERLHLIQAENLKYRHSMAGKLWFLMPALTLMLAYAVSQRNGTSSAYNWWYTTMLPGMTVLYACLCGEKDRRLSDRAILSLPSSPAKSWDAKVVSGIKTVLLANLLGAAAVFLLGNYVVPAIWMPQVLQLDPSRILLAAAVMTVTVLWQVPFCLFLYYKWGMLPALAVDMALNISGIIIAPQPLWIVHPWAAVSRLMTGVIGVLPNGLLAIPGSVTYTKEIAGRSSLLPGMLITAVWLIVWWGGTRLWYERKGAQAV